MKAVKILVDVPAKFVHADEDRQFLRVGQKMTGHVQLDEPRRPKSAEIRWVDHKGRVLGRTAGRYEAYNRRLHFEFDLDQNPFWLHYIECTLEGEAQAERAKVTVSPTSQGWESFPAVTWAHYPEGDFYDRLHELGVNGQIAYRMANFEDNSGNAMRFYVDQCSYWEISLYHRPLWSYWEDKPLPTGYVGHYSHHWKALIEQYKRLRAQAKREGVQISANEHCRKLLWRKRCPNDPGTVKITSDLFSAVVRTHKGFRPLFQNIADEAGIGDQTRPFDFCYCPFCMDKFRLKLEKKYGSLTGLNAQWGTRFTHWTDVFPLTCDETMADQRRGRPFNFASWADHRAFMDDTFAEFFHHVREAARKVDPIGDFSQGGCQWPTPYGGWDYAKVVRTVDAVIPYNIGGNHEIVRSIAPHVKNVSPFFGDSEYQIRQMWWAYIHGNAGIVFWDADEKAGRFVMRPSGKLSRRGRRFGADLREMRGGFAQQINAWQRVDDAVGLLYSQQNERAHWMLETLDERGQIEWFDRVYRSRYVDVRLSWQNMIEDANLQWKYISYLDIDEGSVDLEQFALVILPETIALSDEQVTALRHFVYNGGVLVADGRVGRMTANCRQVARGLLDDLFGIRHGKELNLKSGPNLRPVPAAKEPWAVLDKGIRKMKAADASVRLAPGSKAEVAAMAGQAPAVIRNSFGAGCAIYLNMDVQQYGYDRFDLAGERGELLQSMLAALAEMAGVDPLVDIEDHTLGTSACIEVTRFEQSGGEMFVLLNNRQFKVSGVGDQLSEDQLDSYEKVRRLTLTFPEKAFTHNARTGEYLGKTDQVTQKLPRLSPLVVSRLPYRVRGLDVKLPAKAVVGKPVKVEFSLKADAVAADHVVRVEVYRPDGQWAYWYSDTPLAKGGAGSHSFRLALNDPPGRWKVVLRDIVTGAEVTKSLRVATK